jgi:hypothetical protein
MVNRPVNSVSPLQRSSVGRLWRAYFNTTIYVPDEGRHVLGVLESEGPTRFIQELERLSALGSAWASAILGYMHVVPGSDGKRNLDRALALCENHARSGDAYALFVCGWALIFKRQHKAAYDAMEKAVQLGFSPATLAFALFIWAGWGTEGRHPALAMRALRLAASQGHKGSPIWRCGFYRSGQLGVLHRCLGYILTPFARVPYWLALWTDPFSARVFVFYERPTGPALRPKPRFAV